MDREAREERDRAFNEMLRERLEANRDGTPLRERFIRRPGSQEAGAPSEQEEGAHDS
jgi:hypothetical protein